MDTTPSPPASLPAATPPNLLSIQQKYAWDWFSYHAAQRMTALNYFFVTVGIFAVAYSKCVGNKWSGFGFLVGALGALSSVAFWFLDVRNEELVNCGREALDTVEKQLQMKLRWDDHNRTFLLASTDKLSGRLFGVLKVPFPETRKNVLAKSGRPKFWAGDVFAHHFWLRVLQVLSFAAFAGGSLFAAKHYPPVDSWRAWQWLQGWRFW